MLLINRIDLSSPFCSLCWLMVIHSSGLFLLKWLTYQSAICDVIFIGCTYLLEMMS